MKFFAYKTQIQWVIPCNFIIFKARTRLELREESTAQDAMDVVEIMKYRLRK